jgi:hypothetical protein
MTVAENSTLETYSSVTSGVVNSVTVQAQHTGTNIVFTGSGGNDGQQYRVLSSTNLTLPMAQWTPVQTNVFFNGGNLSNAVPVDPAQKTLYFRIAVP